MAEPWETLAREFPVRRGGYRQRRLAVEQRKHERKANYLSWVVLVGSVAWVVFDVPLRWLVPLAVLELSWMAEAAAVFLIFAMRQGWTVRWRSYGRAEPPVDAGR